MIDRPPFYGIYSPKLLGFEHRCTESDCAGMMESTGYMQFNQRQEPAFSWYIEYGCQLCGIISGFQEREKISLVQEIFRPLYDRSS
jgi:hypothetical protein